MCITTTTTTTNDNNSNNNDNIDNDNITTNTARKELVSIVGEGLCAQGAMLLAMLQASLRSIIIVIITC